MFHRAARIVSWAFLCALSLPGHAAVRYVAAGPVSWPPAYTSVQSAINVSAPGDEVWVAAGTYKALVTLKEGVSVYGGFAGNETVREARNPSVNPTILDGAGKGGIVAARAGVTAATVLDGFVLQNAATDPAGGNTTPEGAVFCDGGSPTIRNNLFRRNNANDGSVAKFLNGSAAVFTGNRVTNNEGGYSLIMVDADAGPVIARNVFTGNNRRYPVQTVIGLSYNRAGRIAGNVFVNNASTRGVIGGQYTGGSVGMTVVNNTIAYNDCGADGAIAGVEQGRVCNNIVAFNSSGISAASYAVLRNNCVTGNTAFNYRGVNDPTGLGGNIGGDPKFGGPSHGNFHIRPDSPCVDAGNDAEIAGETEDVDGQPRIQGARVDIGADESDGSAWSDAPVVWHVRPDGNDAADGLTWKTAKRTVGAALYLAGGGDDVWVAEGSYTEALVLPRGVALLGGFTGVETDREARAPDAHPTAVNAAGVGPVIRVPKTLLPGPLGCTVDGFTLQGGSAMLYGDTGGGISASGAGMTVVRCTFRDNAGKVNGPMVIQDAPTVYIAHNTVLHADGEPGGGIYITNSAGIVEGNTVSGGVGVVGYSETPSVSGIHCENSTVTIRWNTVARNEATNQGGGIYAVGGPCLIANNVLRENRASQGGGIFAEGATVLNNLLAGNNASQGGGLYLAASTATNNTLISNTADDGGGIYFPGSDMPAVNNLIAFNNSGITLAAGVGAPVLRSNLLYGNGRDVVGMDDPVGRDGNIRTDPRLASLATGNAHIQPDSPAVGAGNLDAVPLDAVDLDGDDRRADGRVDIGADESHGTVWNITPRVVRVKPDGDDGADGGTWSTAMKTPAAALSALKQTGGEVWVAEGTYAASVPVGAFVRLYGGFSGVETARDERGPRLHPTVLDGGGARTVATMLGGYRTSGLDGFTVRNGLGRYIGGGVLCVLAASPVIARNVITANFINRAPGVGSPRGVGAGVSLGSGDGLVESNFIVGNASDDGGAIYAYRGRPLIRNNTIAGNTGGARGAVSLGPAAARLVNNVIAFNASGVWTQAAPTPPEFQNNCFFENGAFDVSGAADPVGANGNVRVDPMLAALSIGEAHLAAGSPCVDAGANDPGLDGTRDIDGEARRIGANVDIGADEYSGLVPPRVPRIVRVAPGGSDSNDGSSWAAARAKVQGAIDLVAASGGGEVWVALGNYRENLTLKPYVYLHGGFAGTEDTLAERPPLSADLPKASAVSALVAGPTLTGQNLPILCGVEGMMLRSGRAGTATDGGGIRLDRAWPVIERNAVSSNTGNFGGGIAVTGGSPVVRENVINLNTGRSGGGIFVGSNAAPLIERNRLESNHANEGGGIMLLGGTSDIRNNLFVRNVADIGSGLKVANGVLSGNITNNTFTGNLTTAGRPIGATVYLYVQSNFANNIVAFNQGGVQGAFGAVNNDVYGNTGFDLAGPIPVGKFGNISADPGFVDASAGNYRLGPGSPARDAGLDSVVAPGETDLDGNPRIQGYHVDIGAYEAAFTPPPFPHAVKALRVAAGLDALQQEDKDALNAVNEGASGGVVDLLDALALLRAAVQK